MLYRKKGEQGQPEVFLDPNAFSADGTSALQGTFFTSDGSMLTYMISEGGSDWRKAVIIKTSDKTMVGDTIRNLKFTGIAWKGNEGFYYSRTEGDKLFSRVDFNTLMYHLLKKHSDPETLLVGPVLLFCDTAHFDSEVRCSGTSTDVHLRGKGRKFFHNH